MTGVTRDDGQEGGVEGKGEGGERGEEDGNCHWRAGGHQRLYLKTIKSKKKDSLWKVSLRGKVLCAVPFQFPPDIRSVPLHPSYSSLLPFYMESFSKELFYILMI